MVARIVAARRARIALVFAGVDHAGIALQALPGDAGDGVHALAHFVEHLARVVIDVEYQGHEASIKEHLLNLLRRDWRAARPEFLRDAKPEPRPCVVRNQHYRANVVSRREFDRPVAKEAAGCG